MTSDQFSLDGRVALVTGAGGGLGRSFVKTLAGAGAHVVLCGRRAQPLEAAADSVTAAGGRAQVVCMDVTRMASVREAFDAAESAFGCVDIAICNAGMAIPEPAMTLDEKSWLATIDVNLNGCWRVASEAARRLHAADRPGAIVNVTSILGQRVAGAVAAYAASKGGLEQLTRSLALEWARYGIRVNALAPGYIETDINREFFASETGAKMIKRIPQRRLGQPEDLAGALLLLCSEAGAYMTGSTLVVDGGHLQSTL